MSKESSSSGSFPLIGFLFVLLVVGKLAGWFTISWLWVFLIPVLAGLAWFIFAVFILTFIIAGIALIKVWLENKSRKF